ncbi:predicted protein [Histoplasma capsulatum H143]|uniref:Uncharacterized protein n=1 Tax=Ajellomyces capsulatus (strain H143) TaxID=544712 RepID=C6HD50_AJECH|nr:predicted protein [Histoplasma capsulatum H143]
MGQLLIVKIGTLFAFQHHSISRSLPSRDHIGSWGTPWRAVLGAPSDGGTRHGAHVYDSAPLDSDGNRQDWSASWYFRLTELTIRDKETKKLLAGAPIPVKAQTHVMDPGINAYPTISYPLSPPHVGDPNPLQPTTSSGTPTEEHAWSCDKPYFTWDPRFQALNVTVMGQKNKLTRR